MFNLNAAGHRHRRGECITRCDVFHRTTGRDYGLVTARFLAQPSFSESNSG